MLALELDFQHFWLDLKSRTSLLKISKSLMWKLICEADNGSLAIHRDFVIRFQQTQKVWLRGQARTSIFVSLVKYQIANQGSLAEWQYDLMFNCLKAPTLGRRCSHRWSRVSS